MSIDSPIQTKKIGGKNLALGLVSMFSVAVLGFSGTTFATDHSGGGDNPTNGAPTSKADCKNGGWQKYGFKNQGKCIKWVNEHGYGGGGGGGNQNSSNTWLNLDISGDNNVINIIVRNIFG